MYVNDQVTQNVQSTCAKSKIAANGLAQFENGIQLAERTGCKLKLKKEQLVCTPQ